VDAGRLTRRCCGWLLCGLLCGSMAAAQPSVELFGKLDLGVRRAVGGAARELAAGGDSRLGLRGQERLGGGTSAFFAIEHRFFADTGGPDGPAFWKGQSLLGVAGPFGRVAIGRQYTPAFSLAQNAIDPFGGDTVAQLRDVAMRVGAITRVRVDGSIRYDFAVGGLALAAALAESDKNGGPNRPWSIGASYRAGPLLLVAGHEDPAGSHDAQSNLGAAFRWGAASLSAGYASGSAAAGIAAKGWMVGLDWRLGMGNLKAAYGEQRRGDANFARKLGFGYHHAISARTLVYADIGNDRQAAGGRTGYDLGILHRF
jgi:predicted porin